MEEVDFGGEGLYWAVVPMKKKKNQITFLLIYLSILHHCTELLLLHLAIKILFYKSVFNILSDNLRFYLQHSNDMKLILLIYTQVHNTRYLVSFNLNSFCLIQ